MKQEHCSRCHCWSVMTFLLLHADCNDAPDNVNYNDIADAPDNVNYDDIADPPDNVDYDNTADAQ